jgi:hypothetical protein
MVTGALWVAALVGMPGSAQSQVVIIIGNGAAQPYYPPQPYPYPYAYPLPHPHHDVVYAEPCCFPVNGFGNGYYNYNGYYNNGYYRPYW